MTHSGLKIICATDLPPNALGYQPPAPEAIAVTPRDPGSAMLRQDLWADLSPTLT